MQATWNMQKYDIDVAEGVTFYIMLHETDIFFKKNIEKYLYKFDLVV